MARLKLLFFVFFSIFFCSPLSAQVPDSLDALNWKARAAGTKRDFQSAIGYLKQFKQEAKRLGRSGLIKNWHIDEEIQILKKLIGSEQKQSHVYKVLVVFLDETNAPGLMNSNGSRGTIRSKLKSDTIQKTRLFFEYQKHFVEAFSNGKVKVEVDYQKPGLVLKQMKIKSNSNYPNLSRISPRKKTAQFLYKNYNHYDVFCFIWPKPEGVPAKAHGGIGLQNTMLPHLKNSPSRGYMVIPDSWVITSENRTTFVHELFHTIEYGLGFYQSHGWMKYRKHLVPDFKGKIEYEYYQWRFGSTIRDLGYKNINYTKRFPMTLSKKSFKNYLKLLTRYDSASLQKAEELTRKRQYETALSVIEVYPEALYRLALKKWKQRNDTQAYKWIKKYRMIDKSNLKAEILFAKTLASMKHNRKAVSQIKQIIKRFRPDDYWDQSAIAYLINRLTRKEKDNEKIKELYDLKILMNPFKGTYYRDRGYYYLNTEKDFEEAETDFKKALKLSDESGRSLVALGEFYLKTDNEKQAEYYFKKAESKLISLRKQISQVYLRRFYQLKDRQKKERFLQKALSLAPNNAWAHRAAGFYYRRLRQNDLAIEAFKKSADYGLKKSIQTLKKFYNISYRPRTIREIKNPNAIKVGIYQVYGERIQKVFSPIFEMNPNFQVEYIHSQDITFDKLKHFDLLLMPGGNPRDYEKPIGKKGLREIQKYIRRGGKYLGICAGAFFAVDDKYLNLFAAKNFNTRFLEKGYW